MNCNVIKIEDNIFECTVCHFRHIKHFNRICEPITGPEPFKCRHLGEVTGKIDKKYCTCGNRQEDFPVHFCNKYQVECGLFSMLNYHKKKETLEKGARNCSDCPDRFT